MDPVKRPTAVQVVDHLRAAETEFKSPAVAEAASPEIDTRSSLPSPPTIASQDTRSAATAPAAPPFTSLTAASVGTNRSVLFPAASVAPVSKEDEPNRSIVATRSAVPASSTYNAANA